MKKKRIIAALLTVLLVVVVIVAVNIPKHLNASDASFDLTTIDDGVYQGECSNGLISVEVEVEVQDHVITNINIVKHQNGTGQEAESIVNSVTASQSVEVDAVSGATLSSQTILKAIENALSQ